MPIKASLKAFDKEILKSSGLPSIRGRKSKKLQEYIQDTTKQILEEFESHNALLVYINGLDLGISIDALKESFSTGLSKALTLCNKIDTIDWEQYKEAYEFHYIQSLKKSKKRGVKSQDTRLKVAQRSYLLPGYIIDTLSKKDITNVEGIPQGKKFSDYFSNSNITTICIGYNSPEEKLKEILIKAQEYELLKEGKKINSDDINFCLNQIKNPEEIGEC